MPSPRQVFEESIRPAELLVRVYRLLECERIETGGDLVEKLRPLAGAGRDEDLLLVANDIFLGLIRESAQMSISALRRPALDNLLRQAVVVACTGLDTYLPSLLRANLPLVIEARGREFFPQDGELQTFFKDLTFDLAETAGLLTRIDAPEYMAGRIHSYIKWTYLSSKKGIHIVGTLLQLDKPWDKIATHLERDKRELTATFESTTTRRNDIVHRADRPQSAPEGPISQIGYAWASQAVDTVKVVCFALDELVKSRVLELRADVERRKAEEWGLSGPNIPDNVFDAYIAMREEEAAQISKLNADSLVDEHVGRLLDELQQRAVAATGSELDYRLLNDLISSRTLAAIVAHLE